MTTTTATPFVNTPHGDGVIEVSSGREVFVHFENGDRLWLDEMLCAFDAPRPDWYREPETALIAGWVG